MYVWMNVGWSVKMTEVKEKASSTWEWITVEYDGGLHGTGLL